MINTVANNSVVATTANYSGYVFEVLGNPSFLCLFGSRMFINLKDAGKTEVNDGLDDQESEGRSQSNMQFAIPAVQHSGTIVV